MDYNTAKAYINKLSSRGISPGLDNIKQLLKELKNPEKSLRIIHIAGTNGKGSVGAYLSEIINAYKKNCTRFVSPCVGEYENTFLFNGKSVEKEIIGDCANELFNALERLEKRRIFPTSFEAETALAFLIFKRLTPDYAIIECGMGGREDSTNAVDKTVLSIITSIALDHTAFLGNTLLEIAYQKAGIIKDSVPVICAKSDFEAMTVIKEECQAKNAELIICPQPKIVDMADTYTDFSYKGDIYRTKMLGTYQVNNASLAICAAQTLNIPQSAISEGIKNAQWPYRFERFGKFIFDGAHNPHGAEALAKSLSVYTNPCDTAFICACFKDKDYEQIAKITAPYAKKVYCVTAPTKRGLNAKILCDAFKKAGADALECISLSDAINSANDFKNIVVFGTLSILAEAKKLSQSNQEKESENAEM